ncbi:MAG: hypothetical protein KJZ86_08740 [Caldilineaceae bacterium]|nr:hypothetical protein [Caldilineaceae bacterium]HRJ40501.1 hypothetical protein [Caldilineaceae bacterium]
MATHVRCTLIFGLASGRSSVGCVSVIVREGRKRKVNVILLGVGNGNSDSSGFTYSSSRLSCPSAFFISKERKSSTIDALCPISKFEMGTEQANSDIILADSQFTFLIDHPFAGTFPTFLISRYSLKGSRARNCWGTVW